MVLPIERFKSFGLQYKDMTTSITFTAADQFDAQGKKVDKIFTIKEVENIQYEKVKTLSGKEVAQKIWELEQYLSDAEKKVIRLKDELNFLKTLK